MVQSQLKDKMKNKNISIKKKVLGQILRLPRIPVCLKGVN